MEGWRAALTTAAMSSVWLGMAPRGGSAAGAWVCFRNFVCVDPAGEAAIPP